MAALINMICELKITSGSKKIAYKFHGDPTFRWIINSEKQCYAVMKYIVVELIIQDIWWLDTHLTLYCTSSLQCTYDKNFDFKTRDRQKNPMSAASMSR